MEQLNLITNFLRIKDKNITITDEYDMGTHLELHGHLDYTAPKCPKCKGQMAKYDYQKTSKILYLETAGYPLLIRLRKRRFKCKECGKMAVAETPLVKKNHQISVAVNQKIAQLLIENQAMQHIAHRLSISTSSVMRKLNEFKFETDWNTLPEVMSWDEYAFKKGKMSFIAQDFESLNVIAILDGRTQATIQNHFLRYPRKVRNRVKVITMDMFSPYYQLAKQLFPNAKIVLDRFHIVQHLSRAMNRVRIQIMNQFDRKSQEYRALKPEGRKAVDIENSINEWLQSVPKNLFKSITFDCGKEFSNWKSISNTNDIDIYFADPGTPSQRGLNEHSNGLLRKDGLPKEMDFNQVNQGFISSVASKRNHIPRKSLNYQTPLEVFLSYVNGKFCLA
ncbi:IS1193, transposase, ISL3 family [Streptococcus infantarius subsp. infantarius]|nr:IS1193, transposase, ISL3 family [Streptococcus infantarius subsp. infantarius]